MMFGFHMSHYENIFFYYDSVYNNRPHFTMEFSTKLSAEVLNVFVQSVLLIIEIKTIYTGSLAIIITGFYCIEAITVSDK